MNRETFFIGIAGPSCSGKGTIAQALVSRWAEAFPGLPQRVVVLPQDAYYQDVVTLPPEERAIRNFDEPAAFDWPLMERQFRELVDGRVIHCPVYDFETHARLKEYREVGPADIAIFEGLLALYSESIRDMLSLRIYLDASDAVCRERRIARDVRERGRSRDSVERQFCETVQPMAERWVRPQRAFADVVVDGEGDIESGVAVIIAAIHERCRGT